MLCSPGQNAFRGRCCAHEKQIIIMCFGRRGSARRSTHLPKNPTGQGECAILHFASVLLYGPFHQPAPASGSKERAGGPHRTTPRILLFAGTPVRSLTPNRVMLTHYICCDLGRDDAGFHSTPAAALLPDRDPKPEPRPALRRHPSGRDLFATVGDLWGHRRPKAVGGSTRRRRTKCRFPSSWACPVQTQRHFGGEGVLLSPVRSPL